MNALKLDAAALISTNIVFESSPLFSRSSDLQFRTGACDDGYGATLLECSVVLEVTALNRDIEISRRHDGTSLKC